MSRESGFEFQASCVTRLGEVLTAHGFGTVAFVYVAGDYGYNVAEIEVRGRQHEIEIYETGPVMHCGEQLFESFMRDELRNDEAHREGFAARLDRYLGGGPWDDHREIGFWRWLKGLFES